MSDNQENDKSQGNKEVTAKLTPNFSSLNELSLYLGFVFSSSRQAGERVGLSATRVRQIRTGYKLPRTAKMINRIADGWGIDRTKLTILFERARKEKQEVEK